MSAFITWLTAGYIGNVTANVVHDAGVWTAQQAKRWLAGHWSDPVVFAEVQRELQKAFGRAWRDVEQSYHRGGQWQRISEEQQELIHARSNWLDSRERQALIFPQLVDPTAYAASLEGPDALVPDREVANAALFKHLQNLGILDGLPRDFVRLLEEQLLNGILYHFVEDGIKRNEDLRNVLFFHQMVGLQVGQRVTQDQLNGVSSRLEQLEECRYWQEEIIQAMESLEESIKETIKEGAEQIHAEIADLKDVISPRLVQELRNISPFLHTEDFLGREEELALLKEHWSKGTQFVLVYGLAGVGKSSLVSSFLKEVLQLPADIVFRNDFRLTPNFPSFARMLGAFLQMPPPASEQPEAYVAGLLAALRTQECVLFFDNFEEALRALPEAQASQRRARPLKIKDPLFAQFIAGLLRSEHCARVYFTSRFKPDFGIAGTACAEVPEGRLRGLSPGFSRELLSLRKGDAEITKDEWQAINKQLEGHPAAIELLGQILKERIYSPRELLFRFDALEATASSTPFVERVAEDFLDALYDRLGQEERLCLRRASILRMPFDTTALVALTAMPEMQAKGALDILWRKCLLRRHNALFHYHPLVQGYNLSLLTTDSQECLESHLRAAEYYLLLDQAERPWHRDIDATKALEAIHHLQLVDEERAYTLLEDVSRFLQTRGIAYYVRGDYAASEEIVRGRIARLEHFKDRSLETRRQYGVLHFYLANLTVKQHRRDRETRTAFQTATRYAPEYVPA